MRVGSASKPLEGAGSAVGADICRTAWLSDEVLLLACGPSADAFRPQRHGGGLR